MTIANDASLRAALAKQRAISSVPSYEAKYREHFVVKGGLLFLGDVFTMVERDY